MKSGEAFENKKHLLSMDDYPLVLKTLQQMNVLDESDDLLRIEKAGDGNMNLVMRVTTYQQTFIVKQSRPWVEKYPAIAAPPERIDAEIDFYDRISEVPVLAQKMPAVIAARPRLRLLVLEDLGEALDYSTLYDSSVLNKAKDSVDSVFEQATAWLSQLHNQDFASSDEIGCYALRKLNNAHMFLIPFSNPPEIELDFVCHGLEQASKNLRHNSSLQASVARLGDIYLSRGRQGSALLHGDFYPGSWLSANDGFRVIDPEFCFYGPREFDLGVMAAHRFFCHAVPERSTIEQIVESYGGNVSMPLVCGFAGVELIRRLVGVAQLPLDADLEQRMNWLILGEELVAEFAKS